MDDPRISVRMSDADMEKVNAVKRYMMETNGITMSTSEVLRSCVYYRVNMIKKGKDEE